MNYRKPDLTGKVAVVTGGGGVLCSEFAKALASCGAKVAILNRTYEKAERVASEIREMGNEAIAVSANVLDVESIRQAHQIVQKTYGECDILINGAGGNKSVATCDDEFFSMEVLQASNKKSFFDLEDSGFREVLDLNLLGVLLPTQIFGRDMVIRHSGVIINISSMNAYTPLTKIPAYSAAKAGVTNLTQWLAVYFAESGIRVNAIAPGFFSTEQNKTLLWKEDGSPTPRTEKILRNTPMGRLGKPEDLLGTLLWLVDDMAAGFVTGISVPVDGGFSAYSGV